MRRASTGSTVTAVREAAPSRRMDTLLQAPKTSATPLVEGLLQELGDWSDWAAWPEARDASPRLPGVYLVLVAREVVYVGMAGERSGLDGQRAAQGLWGRLGRYTSGKAATSGFGEAVLDRALADPDFVRTRLGYLIDTGPQRTVEWARAAIAWVQPHIKWTITASRSDALALEHRVEGALLEAGVQLWNQRRRQAPDKRTSWP
jgi:hypothetical protein